MDGGTRLVIAIICLLVALDIVLLVREDRKP